MIRRIAVGTQGNQHVWQAGSQVGHVGARCCSFTRSLVLAFGINDVTVEVERPRALHCHLRFAGGIIPFHIMPAPCLHTPIVQRNHNRPHKIPVLLVKAKRVARVRNF